MNQTMSPDEEITKLWKRRIYIGQLETHAILTRTWRPGEREKYKAEREAINARVDKLFRLHPEIMTEADKYEATIKAHP